MTRLLLICAVFVSCYGTEIEYRGLDDRIVGGESIAIEEAPYQLSYEYNGIHLCGGSIISADWAVCAAHCTINASIANATVRSGSGLRGTGGTLHRLTQIINHERFSRNPTDNDISLLRVATPFIFSTSTQPIPLATSPPPAQTPAVTSGFGRLSEDGATSSYLQQVKIFIVSYESCNASYTGWITKTMICAGVPEGGRNACFGDSGGPLVAGGVLVGIVSWGIGCDRPNSPGVYANVAELREWIMSHSQIPNLVL